MAWKYPLMTAIAVAARRRGVPGPRTAAAALNRHKALDAALAAAWSTAGPQGRARIIDLQLSRGTPAATDNLVTRLHELDAAPQQVLLHRIADLHPTLRRLLGRTTASDAPSLARVHEAQAAINALWLIEHGNAGTLAYLALPRLRDTDPAVRDAAGSCLLGLANARHRPEPHTNADDLPDPRATAAVAESLDQAVARYATHHNPAALQAWVAQGPAAFDPHGAALTALNDPEHAAVPALRALLKDAQGPAVRRGLVGMLGLPTLALAAVAGLRQVAQDGPAALAQSLHGQAHLLDLPAVRRGLARGGMPETLWPEAFDHGAAHTACDALPAWATALPGSPREVLSRLKPLTTAGLAARRLDALRRIMRCAAPLAPRDADRTAAPAFRHALHAALRPLTTDPNPALAALASAWLLRDQARTHATKHLPGRGFRAPAPPNPKAVPNTSTRPRPSVPRHARAHARRVAATAFEPLWHAWTLLPTSQRRRAAVAALRLDPTARERLRCATAAHDADIRTRGHTMLRAIQEAPPAQPAAPPLQEAR